MNPLVGEPWSDGPKPVSKPMTFVGSPTEMEVENSHPNSPTAWGEPWPPTWNAPRLPLAETSEIPHPPWHPN